MLTLGIPRQLLPGSVPRNSDPPSTILSDNWQCSHKQGAVQDLKVSSQLLYIYTVSILDLGDVETNL